MNVLSRRHDPELGRAASASFNGDRPPPSPDAVRASRRTWRDPRLWVGVAIVAVCVLTGARLLGSADDTVRVWATSQRVPAGSVLSADRLEVKEVRFGSASLADRYLSADQPLPEDAVLGREVLPGELVPRSALASDDGEETVQVPIAVRGDRVPAGLRQGDLVDVWVAPATNAPAPAGASTPEAVRVLQEVRVVAVPRAGSAFGPTTTRQVVVGVPAADEEILASALAQVAGGEPVLVRRG